MAGRVKVCKVLANKGTKMVGQLTSGEKGVTVMLCACIAAVGRVWALVFPEFIRIQKCHTVPRLVLLLLLTYLDG